MKKDKYYTVVNGVRTQAHRTWLNMISRCTNLRELEKFPRYRECIICEEWMNFQVFAKWFYENYYEVKGQIMCLDKDILNKNNKIYSPDNCIFVPNEINVLFTKSNAIRGNCPIGVYYEKCSGKYKAQCSYIDRETNKKKKKSIGRYRTPEEAFYNGCKPFKERYIKQIAEYYKDEIPQKLYNAMYKYEVEIDD